MNPSSHSGMTLGPIGVVAAPGPAGPVGIGIGVPLISPGQYEHSCSQNRLISPDSSDDKDASNKFIAHIFSSSAVPTSLAGVNCPPNNNMMSWSNPLLSSSAAYPLLGMRPHDGVLYSLIGPGPTGNGPNLNIATNSSGVQQFPPEQLEEHGQGQIHKEIIHCKSCTLFPPNPSVPPPTTREKPKGCRTVFVGGLPESTTEEIIRELFNRCGEISTIRMSKKNFCHIRFEMESSIEDAIYLSGYRVRIGSNADPQNVGRLHVDYAQARDDLYEFECRTRQALREQRHRERVEKERLLPPSPPTIAPFSEHEASLVAEKIKTDDSFIKGLHVLGGWLDRGDCLKKNSNSFYSMIQSTNSHVRRLLNEKSQYETELQKAQDLTKQRMRGLLLQFSQIEKVFASACHKKAWDHFSKAQRKNIEMWRKQANEIKNNLLQEALAERNDEEMEFSSGSESENEKSSDEPSVKKQKREENKAISHLKEENDSLRCQLEASNNEVDLIKGELRAELEVKDGQLRNMQNKLTDQEVLLQTLKCGSTDWQKSEFNGGSGHCDSSGMSSEDKTFLVPISERDARLICIVSTFLHVHPFGASIDYIWSYTQKVLSNVRANQIEALMSKFPSVFKQEISGVGATLERKWIFLGFQ